MAYFSAIIVFFSSFLGLPLDDGSIENDGYTYKNIQYGHHERQVVDLYLPKNSDGEVGLILFIHGGGWKAGSKEEYVSTAPAYVEKYGCAAAALNYRYVSPIEPKAVFSNSGPTDLTDENYYHCNPDDDDEELASLLSQACGKRFCYKNRAKTHNALLAVSPVTYVDADTVPTVINHGVKDSVVPFSNALTIVSRLEECGVKYDFNIYPNSNHTLESDPENAETANNLFTEYVLTYLGAEK